MIEFSSESDKRLIVKGELNGKKAYMLIDTGATVGMYHSKVLKAYKLSVNKNRPVHLVSASGDFTAYACDTPFILKGRELYQFVVSDIGGVVESIRRQTGIEIQGVISLPQCKVVSLEIDTDDNLIRIL